MLWKMHLAVRAAWALSRATLRISAYKRKGGDVLCLKIWLYLVPRKNKQSKAKILNVSREKKKVFNHNSKLSFSSSLTTF